MGNLFPGTLGGPCKNNVTLIGSECQGLGQLKYAHEFSWVLGAVSYQGMI